jgi:isopentenyl phosphate kinase
LEGLILLKLGGSVITNKKIPLTPNLKAIDALSKRIAEVHTPMVLVHGAGSYGHYYAQQFGLGTRLKKASEEGVSKTRMAVMELNTIVVKSLEGHGLHTYSLPPTSFIGPRGVNADGVKLLNSILTGGLLPITYGDVLPREGRWYIASGDTVVRMLAERLKPTRVIFTSDVDGIYVSNRPPYKIYKEIELKDRPRIELYAGSLDVTGGMALKLREARRIARRGISVCFVNGFKPERVIEALKGKAFYGSLVKGIRSAR